MLPAAELNELVNECGREVPEVSVAPTGESAHRGLDPTIAGALITGLINVVIPFVTKLAERVFAKEPEAVVTLTDGAGEDAAVLFSRLAPDVRDRLVKDALASGALRVRISLEPAST